MKNKNSYNFLLDLRVYYVIALAVIFIWVPMDYINRKGALFIGYDWIWNSNEKYQINLIFLGLEFIFITVIFILFKKK